MGLKLGKLLRKNDFIFFSGAFATKDSLSKVIK